MEKLDDEVDKISEKDLEQGQETRKLQYTGGSSYIVSLPKKWIQDLGLKQGDHVHIVRNPLDRFCYQSVAKAVSGLF